MYFVEDNASEIIENSVSKSFELFLNHTFKYVYVHFSDYNSSKIYNM